MKVIWNFWETGHGKGIIDVPGGTLESKADDKVPQGPDITEAKRFMDAVKYVKIGLLKIMSTKLIRSRKLYPKI